MSIIVTNLNALRGTLRILQAAYNSQVRSYQANLASKRRASTIKNTRKIATFYKRRMNKRRSFTKK